MSEIKSHLTLSGCGNYEMVLEHPDWKWDKFRVVIFVTLDDWQEFIDQGQNQFKLNKGEKPVKATGYIMMHPDEIHVSWYHYYDIKPKDMTIISELYSQYGSFVEIPLFFDEYWETSKFEEDLKTEMIEDFFDLIMQKIDKIIKLEEKENFLENFTRDEKDEI